MNYADFLKNLIDLYRSLGIQTYPDYANGRFVLVDDKGNVRTVDIHNYANNAKSYEKMLEDILNEMLEMNVKTKSIDIEKIKEYIDRKTFDHILKTFERLN